MSAQGESHESQPEEPQQQIFFNSFDPRKFEEIAQQQQQNTFDNLASSTPQISSYFENSNGMNFDIPQQLETIPERPVVSAPPQMQAVPTHYIQQDVSQQFYAPAPAAQVFEPEQLQQSPDNKLFELQQQLNQQNIHISHLMSELEFHRTTAMSLQKNTEELNRLRQETQSHVDVVKVLVSEKSNLLDSLQKSEMSVKAKVDENEELQSRLNMSRHRVKQLESEMKNSSNKIVFNQEADAKKVEDIIAAKIRDFQESNERLEVEKNELKVLMSQKRIEMENLQKNFDHLNTELHLANVKIAQLSDGATPEVTNQAQVNALNQDVAIKQQQITELYSIIDQLNRDKEASDNQYQNYVSHLTREMETLKESSTELSSENDLLVKREQDLLRHVSDLERQIQQQIQKQKTYTQDQIDQTSAPAQEEIQKLSSQIAALTEVNESLKSQLGKIEAEKNEIDQKLLLSVEEMKNMELQVERLMTETPNLSRLMTDFEDKSVAASRAVSQNQGLKDQLEEMQRAFITMTNDKMELTDKLQTELHLCKEMKTRYDSMETELQSMKDQWHFKEDEMIRLSHENTELEKKIFQQNIEIDRLRHYESKEYHGTEGIVEKELDNSRRLIETLTNKINVLESGKTPQHQEVKHDHSHAGHGHSHDGHGHSHAHDDHSHSHDDHDHSHDNGHDQHHNESPAKKHSCKSEASTKHLLEEIEMLKMEKSELLKAMNDFQMSKKTIDKIITNDPDEPIEMNEEAMKKLGVSKSVTPSMATEEALEKLQARFRRTMLEVAELTEEKQRLEHVVTQLQFETETIGEYITLYQYQRRLLKQKEHERDIQLKNLASDRERINNKLLQLNGLIEKFVLQHTDDVELAKEASRFLDQSKDTEPLIIAPDNHSENMLKMKQETAGKILEILSDIKTANSISYESNVGVENCSCCLGKLETV